VRLTELLDVLADAPGLEPWQYKLISEASNDGVEVPPLETLVTVDGFIEALDAMLPSMTSKEIAPSAHLMFDSIVGTENAVMGELHHVGGSLAMVCTDDLDAACRAAFDGFDRDRNGTLDEEELTTFLASSMRMISALRDRAPEAAKQAEVVKAMARVEFDRIDEDHSGTIEYGEFHGFFMGIVLGRKKSSGSGGSSSSAQSDGRAHSVSPASRVSAPRASVAAEAKAKRAAARAREPVSSHDHSAASGAKALVDAARAGVPSLVAQLCRAGVDVDAPDAASGDTAAYIAAQRGDVDTLRVLILAGCALHRAGEGKRRSPVEELLQQHGALIHAVVTDEIVGHAIVVQQADESTWISATVLSYDAATMVHSVSFDRGGGPSSTRALVVPTVVTMLPFRDVELFGTRPGAQREAAQRGAVSRSLVVAGSSGGARSSGSGSGSGAVGSALAPTVSADSAIVVRATPSAAQQNFVRAQEHYAAERFHKSFAMLRAVVEAEEAFAERNSYKLVLGMTLSKLGRVDDAIAILSEL
jgi:Ca2+-binding EF-hand superfamily protein